MSQNVRDLEPRTVWNHFADLNAVPRPSKKEQQAVEFVTGCGAQLGLPTSVDDVGNVIIRKPASPGMQDRVPIVMQAHLDMVCQKNADTDFDFDTQGIDMYVDGDWVKARGTTLGADNGMGVASIMAVLTSSEIEHPAVEALFTIDEETGMSGAQHLSGGLLHGKILLNLDTEDDNELTIGCAGAVDVTATLTYTEEQQADMSGHRLIVRGLTGGHSGMDIHLGRANANKIMNRLLWHADRKFSLRVAAIDGGGLRNAIPRESAAMIAVPVSEADSFATWLAEQAEIISAEYRTTDPEMEILIVASDVAGQYLPATLQTNLLAAIYACPNGVARMSPDMEDLVQTSNNLARVLVGDGQVQICCLTRSAVNSERDDLADAIRAALELAGVNVQLDGSYPGWQPVPDSSIVKLMSSLHDELFSEPAHVVACHGGLECGILGQNYPDMEMISFGPNIRGAHSPDERVQISSVRKFWTFLQETLQRIPTGS